MVVGFFPSVVIGSEWACDTFAASETGGKVCCQATGLGFHLPRKESTPSSPGRCPVRWWHLEFYANLNLQREWARGLRPMMRTSIWRGGTWSPGNIFYPVTVSSSGPWISSRSISSLPFIMEFPPQLSGCCWEREIGFSNIVLHSWVAAHSVTTLPFSCRMGFLWLVQPNTALPLAKFLFLSPMHSNSYIFFSNGMVVSPLWKVGLLQKLFHLGVSTQITTLLIFPGHD